MDELRELPQIADLERVSNPLLAWDQGGVHAARRRRGARLGAPTVGRLAHERFTDERVGALLAEATPRDELEAPIVRVARRDFDKASRVSGELVANMARAGRGRARGLDAGAREANDFAPFPPFLERGSRCAGATARASPRPRTPTTPCSTTTSRG